MSELGLVASPWWRMHELPVTKSIYDIVLRHAANNNATRVISVDLEIGALSDLQSEWMQRYFDHLSRGTVAAEAKLRVNRVPAVFRCKACQQSFEIHSLIDDDLACVQCSSGDLVLQSGRQYMVKSIEVL